MNTPTPPAAQAWTPAPGDGSPWIHALDDQAVIAVAGADAASFLHGQLTHDVTGLPADRARLAGYCTAKGRLLATMVFWNTVQDETPVTLLLVKRDLADSLIKRLGMFVLRAKARLALTELRVFGVQAADPTALAAVSEAAGATLPAQPWQRTDLETGTWIAAPVALGAAPRWWWIASLEQLAGRAAALAAGAGDALPWQAADLAAGLPWIRAATQDVFIPQTLNLELIDGVSFSKGCYPGQEVVARSHYRGTVKRRMAYGQLDAAPAAGIAPGVDTYSAQRPDEPSGRVVDAAGASLLFETPLADLEHGGLRLGAADGPAITVLPLPYPLTAAKD